MEDIRRNAKLFSEDREKATQLNELIDRITIYETPGVGPNRIGKEKTITIYYKFVGAIQ